MLPEAELSEIKCPSCGDSFSLLGGTPTADAADAVIRIAHFELVEQLGMGAFGAVWRARDTKLDRIVAVKIPRRGQLNAEETELFLREARSAAQLRHPNIVSVHEVGRDGDYVYLVSELIHGISLDKWLEGQQLTAREAADICAKIAGALRHAHEKGVIHRDLKPQNVLMDATGEPHLTDFGLAKREAGEITMTMEGQLIGTPAYMSPEQARGEAHGRRRSDVYSLGVVLFQLLTGELPFRGNVRMLLKQVLEEESPSPRRLNSALPKDLETICLKCLEKQPTKRYATASALADDLNRYLKHEPIKARPIGIVGRTWRWSKRNPAAALATSLIVFVAVAAPISALKQRSLARRASEEADKTRRYLYIAQMNLCNSSFENNEIELRNKILESQLPQAGQKDLRGFEWYYWWRQCHAAEGQFQLGYPGAFDKHQEDELRKSGRA